MIMNMTEKTTDSALKTKIEWNETMDMLYFICDMGSEQNGSDITRLHPMVFRIIS